MAAPTAVFAGAGSGPESRRSPRQSELWNLVGGAGGSSAADTVAITTKYMKRPQLVVGAVTYTISGQVVTVAILTAIGDGLKEGIEIVGLP